MAKLQRGFQVVALKLQEAMMQGDVQSRLRDTIADYGRASGNPWGCYYIDHDGAGDSGNVVYSSDGDIRMSSYEIGDVGGKASCSIDFENSVNVVPVTTYQPEAEDEDHYTAMQESFVSEKLYTSLPIYERFISKDTRKAASSDDFAGKGRSFPILKAEDVSAALHSIGRAGPGNYSSDVIRANIKRIATRKGFALPDSLKAGESGASKHALVAESAIGRGVSALRKLPGIDDTYSIDAAIDRYIQGGDLSTGSASNGGASGTRESGSAGTRETRHNSTALVLVESASTLEQIVLKEAKADYEIKLIAPGKGSSAFYPKEVLQRDGPKVFTAGTHVYLNHPTSAEEAARPEGDVKNLAGVLTSAATYSESHAKGPGLYARMKVFADHGQMVEEKAAHVGMSIRASGVAESGKQKDGLPILKELTSAESVDVVTRAGAGGMILTESARGAQGDDMDEATVTRLVEAGVAKALAAIATPVKTLEARALRGDATVEATKVLSGLALAESSKQRVIESVLRDELPLKEGVLDLEKFGVLVNAEAKREAAYVSSLTGGVGVRGMGNAPVQVDEAEAKRITEAKLADDKDAEDVFKRFGLSEASAKAAARGRAA